jgi:chemotaxis methyl-accepting protein methylase
VAVMRDQNSTTTCFFRNRTQLAELVQRVIPVLWPQQQQLDVLVIGGSIGCEALSLAIAMRQQDPRHQFRILSTDRQESVLAEGRTGRYAAALFEPIFPGEGGTPIEIQTQWFRPLNVPGTIYQADHQLLADVRFARFDVLQDPVPGTFDLVICQNVLVHMEDADADTALRLALDCARAKCVFLCGGMKLDLRRGLDAAGLRPWAGAIDAIHDGWASHRMHYREHRGKYYFELEDLDRNRPNWEERYASIFYRDIAQYQA